MILLKPIVFQYKPLRGRSAPLVKIGVNLGQRWYAIEGYVDSGAGYTVLRSGIAHSAGFDYRTGRRILAQVGDGSFIAVYLHDLEIQIGPERFIGNIGFSPHLRIGFNLVGRASVFNRFKVCFDDHQGILTFEPRR